MARKILLADDSVTAQNMGRKILADAGYDVLTVNNGSAALKRVAESQPDLIILDVYMPGYSGLEVCQRLKDAGETAHIPVLLSVGKLEPFKPQEARRVRADAHIVKPFEASQLLTAIARLEDQMVPQQKSNRFATSGAAASDDPFTRSDESRILGRNGKQSRKGKDASERGDPLASSDNQLSSQAATFRDFKKKSKSQAPGSSAADYSSDAAIEPASHEPGPLAKLPGDITAEELSALSEVAAQLNEPTPATQEMPSPRETSEGSFGAVSAAIPAGISDSQLEAEVARLPVVEAQVSAASVPAVDEALASAPTSEEPETESVEPPRHAVKNFEVSAPAKKEIEIPVAQFEAASSEPAHEVAVASEPDATLESQSAESQTPESRQNPQGSDAELPDAVSMASFAQEPAPVDQQDEPMFASGRAEPPYAQEPSPSAMAYAPNFDAPGSAQVFEPVNVESANIEKDETTEASASGASSFAPAAVAESSTTVSGSADPAPNESSSTETPALESISTEAAPVAASPSPTGEIAEPVAAEPEAPMPSDEALAEALRLLMPASTQPEPEQPIYAASQSSDPEETMEMPAGKRWVVEAMTLTPEESSMSLEAEMFRSFAASAEKIEALPVEDPLAAIQLAVENRLAAEAAEAAQLEAAGQASPKAMAAVAPAGVSLENSTESDIASIVEKVMADLRPKIVEEIARKLAGK